MREPFLKKTLFIALAVITILVSCKKENEVTPNDSSSSPIINASDISGLEKWTNGNKSLNVQFIKEKGVITGFDLPDVTSHSSSFIKKGTVVTEISQTISGTTKTIQISYDGSRLTNITGGISEFTFEYDADHRINQINKGTTTFYEFTYTDNNVTAIKKTQGINVTDYVINYDAKPNPFYNDVNMRVFTIDYLFNVAPHNWALDYLITFSENNVTKISWDGKDLTNTYHKTGTKLDSVTQVSSWNPTNPITYILKY